MGALWTKSIRWWRVCDGSVTLPHYLLLKMSSARAPQKYIVKDFMVENACKDFFLYMGLETGIQRRFFWFCISGFCVLIIYSQESSRRREGLLRKCIYVRLYITTSGQKYRIINYKISDWRPLDTSHEVGGWKKTAKYNENCKKRTQKKMKIQKKKDEILFLVVYLNL